MVANFRSGFHEYAELLELLAQSGGGLLRGTMGDDMERGEPMATHEEVPAAAESPVADQPLSEPAAEPEPEPEAREPSEQDRNTADKQAAKKKRALSPESREASSPPAAVVSPAGGSAELWPLSKVMARMASLPEGAAGGGGAAVLVLTGALNPVHCGHVLSLEYAREACEAAGITVLGGFLSPSHDSYVGPKMQHARQRCWDAATRVAACEAAVAESDWLAVGRWEAMGPHSHWPDYPVVCRSLATALGKRTAVYYVCGYDHYQKCGLSRGMGLGVGLAVLPRDDNGKGGDTSARATAQAAKLTSAAKRIVGVGKAPPALSSTLIRQRLREGGEMAEGWLPPGVAAVLGA